MLEGTKEAEFEEFHVDPHENGFGYVLRLYPSRTDDGSCSWVDVKACAVEMLDGEGRPRFTRADAVTTPDPESDFDKSDLAVDGHIKFDGCAEFDFGRQHFCHGYGSPGGFHALAVTVQRAYDEARRIMGTEEF